MTSPAQAAPKDEASYDQFLALDIRVATVTAAPLAEKTRAPCRVLELDLGPLGSRTSVGQYALLAEDELVGRKVLAIANFARRRMGKYWSEALVLGTPHPNSPAGQSQAVPLWADDLAAAGDAVF